MKRRKSYSFTLSELRRLVIFFSVEQLSVQKKLLNSFMNIISQKSLTCSLRAALEPLQYKSFQDLCTNYSTTAAPVIWLVSGTKAVEIFVLSELCHEVFFEQTLG